MSLTRAARKPHPRSLVVRPLRRTELPANTSSCTLPHRKNVVRDLPAGRLSGRIVETEA